MKGSFFLLCGVLVLNACSMAESRYRFVPDERFVLNGSTGQPMWCLEDVCEELSNKVCARYDHRGQETWRGTGRDCDEMKQRMEQHKKDRLNLRTDTSEELL